MRRAQRQNRAAEFVLSEADVQTLFSACGLRDRTLLELLYYSALRRAEAIGLDVPDVDFNRNLVRVRQGKGAKERFVPLHPDCASHLRTLIGERTKGPIFMVYEMEGTRLGLRGVNHVFEKLAKSTGIRNPNPRMRYLNPHLLRHSFARHFLANGGSLRDLSHLMGHSGIAITADVYGTPTMEDLLDGYRRVVRGADRPARPPDPDPETRVDAKDP